MSYTALYRKFRPDNFDDVKGQDHIVTTLTNQIKHNRIGHAYLFCGTRGTGKTTVAKILAKAVNCQHPVNGSPCGECDMCKAIQAGTSMNVIEIDAASNNGVDNIREIREEVAYRPTEGNYKVYIIDEVHMLSTGAFNALLKTLEEPPSYVIFILATTEAHKIPITIMSRCQRYDFHRISIDTIAARLDQLLKIENVQAEEKALRYVAKAGDGSMRDALSLLDECVAFHPDEELSYDEVLEILGAVDVATYAKLFSALSGGRGGEALCILDRAFEEGSELSQFVNDFLWYLRNLLILKTAEHAEGMIDSSGEKLELMKKDAAEASTAVLMRYIRVLSELSNRLRFSSQKRVMTELTLIRLTAPEMDDTNDALLERVAALERELKTLKAEGIRTVQTAALETPAEKKPAEPKTIALPRAEYEDFMAIRTDWGKITASIGGAYGAALQGSSVEPAGPGAMCIVFPNAGVQRFGGLDGALELLSQYVAEHYQKEISFRTRARVGMEATNSYTVSAEELREIVDFPIETERGSSQG